MPGAAEGRSRGGDVHDRPARRHLADGPAGTQQVSENIDFQGLPHPHPLRIGFGQRPHRPAHAGVVHQPGDRPQALGGDIEHMVHVCRVGGVDRDCHSRPPQRTHPFGHALGSLGIRPVPHGHIVPLGRQSQADRRADAPTAAGDHSHSLTYFSVFSTLFCPPNRDR
ncbi:hypothetical protein ScoT_29940 [Streptomyces albidoflavus]|uniref:Uncharacterized protein n=1 Tax=Streptomyces albidoflavus TaxID=1886 RepID=A0AA37FCB1_9ACTN|nr:hypothetical protein ScoT_29940 [Streptomyces albidoflavus]